jgi:hypothetical protein
LVEGRDMTRRLSADRAERIRLLKEALNLRSQEQQQAHDALVSEVLCAYDDEHPPLSELAEAAGYSSVWVRQHVNLTKRVVS